MKSQTSRTRTVDVAQNGRREFSEQKALKAALRDSYPVTHAFGTFCEAVKRKKWIAHVLQQHSIPSADSLGHLVKSIPAGIKVISFDFFDTLAARHTVSPERVLIQASRFLATKLCQLGCPVSAEYVFRVRQAMEKTERENAVRLRFRDPEARLESILKSTVTTILGHAPVECVRDAVEYESSLEQAVLTPVDGALEAVAAAAATGARVVITSEMYLHHEHIQKFSDAFGFSRYVERIFVSSEFLFMKGSGRIYDYVAQAMGVDPAMVAHIGDNMHADVIPPLHRGVKAHFVNVEKERERNAQFIRAVEHFEKTSLSLHDGDQVLSALRLKPEQWLTGTETALARSLNRTVAPALCAFIHETFLKLTESGAQCVYFLAREGLVLKECFDEFVANNPAAQRLFRNCQSKILFISRKTALTLEYPRTWTPSEFLRLTMSRTPDLSRQRVLIAWGLSPDCLSDAAAQEYDQMQARYPRETFHESLLAMLEASTHFRAEIDAALSARRIRTEEYLKQQGIFDQERIALVDLGWVGTISRCISAFAKAHQQPLAINTYLFATSPAHFLEQGIDPVSLAGPPGIILDGGRNPLSFQMMTDCASILEVIFGDDRLGTTIDYVAENGTFAPVFNQHQRVLPNELVQAAARAVFANAIKAYSLAVDTACVDVAALKRVYAHELMIFLRFPRREDVALFADCALDMGVGYEGMEPVRLIGKLSLRKLFRKDFLLAGKPYLWRRGSFAMSSFPKWVSCLYERVFLLQIAFPSINGILRRFVRWDPFIW